MRLFACSFSPVGLVVRRGRDRREGAAASALLAARRSPRMWGGGRVSLLLLYPGDLCSHRRTRVTGRTRLRAGRPRSSALRQPRGSRSSSSVGGSPGRTRGRRSPRRRGLYSLPQSLVLSTAHSASFLNNRSINTYFSINVRHFSF